ncbi:hypothetical protein GUJ93_ZPchr0003g17365 [Zizania palustris]|uniref:Uncharacterized protein n=1 Tax=Zizania palustris TaxID=103762 RepID=A0A8J5VYJ8_ZIZPA|nr:hypothetical protein GUJ93_ZPchr0003g17365 [Zizania palustris]
MIRATEPDCGYASRPKGKVREDASSDSRGFAVGPGAQLRGSRIQHVNGYEIDGIRWPTRPPRVDVGAAAPRRKASI